MTKLTNYKDGGEIRIFLGKKAFALTPIEGITSTILLGDGNYRGSGTTIHDIENSRVMFQVREDIQIVEDKLINGW
jgi:hypothetical protein